MNRGSEREQKELMRPIEAGEPLAEQWRHRLFPEPRAEVVDGCPALLQTVAKRLQRDVQSDLVTEFEAVDDGLGWG